MRGLLIARAIYAVVAVAVLAHFAWRLAHGVAAERDYETAGVVLILTFMMMVPRMVKMFGVVEHG